MSIIWLEALTNTDTTENVIALEMLNTIIYLNLIPVIIFVLYYIVYKMDVYMQKAPSNITLKKTRF
jgi:hypothetical protein